MLEALCGQFLVRLETERGFSPHTLTAYRRDLAQFFLADPDVSRLTAAAPPALLTAKVQPVRVPFPTHRIFLPIALISAQLLTANILYANT